MQTTELYCSLDLELTGFDPLKDEILEVGFVFFRFTSEGLQIEEEWSQVFRPTVEVHPKILGLTGITQAELDSAPLLSEYHQFLKDKLSTATIVGHNIVLDIKFLEAFGVPMTGPTIDTLELVQFILPTHHSYNLENLIHYFSITHERDHHRALGDSIATMKLLEQLAARYKGFPEELQDKIISLASRHNLYWTTLFSHPLDNLQHNPSLKNPEFLQKEKSYSDAIEAGISASDLIVRPLDETSPENTLKMLERSSGKYLLVIADKAQVLRLWKDSLADGLFHSADQFNEEKFNSLLNKDMSVEEARFCLKILVWLATNWQTKTIVDLNLSFAGGQFRSSISGINSEMEKDSHIPEDPKILCCDYETFLSISHAVSRPNERVPVLWTAHGLESWFTEGHQGRLTWNKVLYLLRSVYNPETNYGREDLRDHIIAGIAAADLFFGLTNLLLRQHFYGHSEITYEQLEEQDYIFNKIRNAAQGFVNKLYSLTDIAELVELKNYGESLIDFFESKPNQVKWIETSEFNCVFVNRPLHLAPVLDRMSRNFPSPIVVDNIAQPKILKYILERLGLASHAKQVSASVPEARLNGVLLSADPTDEGLLALLQPGTLPAVVLFPTLTAVKSFYSSHYSYLKGFSRVFAQGYSGGSNKILRNFSIGASPSVLLATPQFLVRAASHKIQVKSLILYGMPPVEESHPYIQALLKYWEPTTPNYIEILRLQRFYLILQKLDAQHLGHIYVFSSKDMDLLEKIPEVTFATN